MFKRTYIYICLRAVAILDQVKYCAGSKCILDQAMSYKDSGTAAAKDLIGTPELQEMIEQSNLFMFDNKGRLSTQKNKKLLSALQGLQDELPSIADLDLFVKTVDTHLLMVISQDRNKSKQLYKIWVKTNAEFAKQ